MSRNTVVHVILGALIVALLALQVATMARMNRLQEQVAKLEERPAGAGGAGSAVADGARPGEGGVDAARAAGGRAEGGGPGADGAGATGGAPAGTADAGGSSARRPAARPADGALTEKDIEAMIEKKLAEHDKKNPLSAIMNFEDPLAVMERELKLSPIQKTRIQQHFKERDDAVMELWQSEEARKDWRGTEEKAGEIRKKCEESVKRELDLAQQDKYEELKKAGKISDFGGGMSIVIDRNDGEGEAK